MACDSSVNNQFPCYSLEPSKGIIEFFCGGIEEDLRP
ncbi:hypothetical protein OROGR_027581 [Orobanche gracilis]